MDRTGRGVVPLLMPKGDAKLNRPTGTETPSGIKILRFASFLHEAGSHEAEGEQINIAHNGTGVHMQRL